MAYDLPPLPYGFDALEPWIDAKTMELHHNKHHRAYVDKLNAAIAPFPVLADLTIEQLLRKLDDVPAEIRQIVRDQGGGHANHQFFWKIIRPGGAAEPTGALADAFDEAFGSFSGFKDKFEEIGAKHFGSGWVFLATGKGGHGLEIVTTANQDSVLTLRKPGLMLNDLWEHAYYLKHQNRRPDYLTDFWNIVNWTVVADRLDAIRSGDEKRLGGPAR